MKKKKSVKEIRNKYSHNDRQDVVRFAEQNPEYSQKMLCEKFWIMRSTMSDIMKRKNNFQDGEGYWNRRDYDLKENENDNDKDDGNDEEPKQVSYKEVKTAFVDFIAPYLESGEEQHIDLIEKLRLAIETIKIESHYIDKPEKL